MFPFRKKLANMAGSRVGAAAVENCLIIDRKNSQGKVGATNVEMELLACAVSRKRYNRSRIENSGKKNNIVHNCHSRDQSYTALTTVCALSRL